MQFYNPEYSGEGVAIEEVDGQVFGEFYTYNPDGTQRWFALTGKREGNKLVTEAIKTHGGAMHDPAKLKNVVRETVGTIVFTEQPGDTLLADFNIQGYPRKSYVLEKLLKPIAVVPAVKLEMNGRVIKTLPAGGMLEVFATKVMNGPYLLTTLTLTAVNGSCTISNVYGGQAHNVQLVGITRGDVLAEGQARSIRVYVGPLTGEIVGSAASENFGFASKEHGPILQSGVEILR